MMVNRSHWLLQNLKLGKANRGHGTDEVEERGFTSGHKPSLNAEYMTATQTWTAIGNQPAKGDGSYMIS
jgi:hypothetical protein